ncbi:hypothetical protein Q4602_04330 [Paraglaciecola chathamensis]|nr:hypothetical protein [Paraglaciecola chathamensis]MDO6838682.1 hypothetical protein [Paraglaciecola chathamensis]
MSYTASQNLVLMHNSEASQQKLINIPVNVINGLTHTTSVL